MTPARYSGSAIMGTIDYREFEKMSPFEIKDGLLKLAKRSARAISA